MDKYYIDERVLPALRSALDEDIRLNYYTGSFESLAKSVSRKIASSSSPCLSTEEYGFLQGYVRDLVVTEIRSGPYQVTRSLRKEEVEGHALGD